MIIFIFDILKLNHSLKLSSNNFDTKNDRQNFFDILKKIDLKPASNISEIIKDNFIFKLKEHPYSHRKAGGN